MKKHIKITCLAIISALTLNSCGDDYLEKEPSDRISQKQFNEALKGRPSLVEASLRGIYKAMYDTGTGGTSSHTDFGQKGYDIMTDMLSQDMALSRGAFGWYTTLAGMSATRNYVDNTNYMPWRYYYRIINATNLLLKSLKNEDGTYPTDEETNHVKGQALAIRAYSYFMLANLYNESLDSADKKLPVYLEPSVVPEELKSAPEVLDIVISDLETAVNSLEGFKRDSKNQINQEVAKVMLAYAYGAKGENAKALKQVTDVINTTEATILAKDVVAYNSKTGKGDGFNSVNSPSWIWGQDVTLDDGLDLISWWGQMDYFTYGYQAYGNYKSIDAGLYDQIPEDDVRKIWFNNALLLPINKFYDSERVHAKQRNISTDYVYMRIEEAYLLAAEFAAKTGNDTDAKKYLKHLLTQRVEDASYVDNLSGKGLLDQILLQTRIEMWGEGKSYLLMKRNKSTVTRGKNHLTDQGESFPSDYKGMTFEIPQKEVESNPNY